MLDEEFFLKLALGEEGVTFTIEETGYYPILPAFNDERGLADKFLIGSREVDYGQYWLCRTRKTQAQDKLFSRVNWNAAETGVASVIGFMPSNEAYDNYYSGANRELTTALVTTMFGTDRMTVDQLRAVFDANGGDLVKESVNEWYAAWEGKDLLK
jgi:putative aldouronate transport system substrate-binding protein